MGNQNPRSFKSLKTSLSLIALMALLVFQYQNCAQYNDPSLFDGVEVPGASSSAPTEVRLDSPNGIIDISTTDAAFSFGGECNVGLELLHYIEVKILNSNNQPIQVRADSLCPMGATSNPECFRATHIRCEHGRYNIHLPLTCQNAYLYQTRSDFRLQAQLVTFDSSGNEIRDSKASFERFVSVNWDPSPDTCR